MRDENPAAFADEALRALLDLPDSEGAAHLLRLVMLDLRTLERFTDPRYLPLTAAAAIAVRMQALDVGVATRLLQLLLSNREAAFRDPSQAARVLDIVAAISDGTRIQSLMRVLLQHPDPRIRSKAALVSGRLRSGMPSAQQLNETDPRVRANVVESMWGSGSPEAREAFLLAVQDPNHRVAANGVVGLHRAGDVSSARLARTMLQHADPGFRAAAAWAMGETQDPRFLPVLQGTTEAGPVHRNALRAIVLVRKRVSNLRLLPALNIQASAHEHGLEVRVHSAEGEGVARLPPTAFVVTQGSECLDIESVVSESEHYEIRFMEKSRRGTCVAVYSQTALGEGTLSL